MKQKNTEKKVEPCEHEVSDAVAARQLATAETGIPRQPEAAARLNPEELAQVAGGVGPPTVTKHPMI